MAEKAQPFCPCGKQLKYQNCCQKFHLGLSKPQTAEELMRSRYSAFAKKNGAYLVQTLHPEKFTHQTLTELKAAFEDCFWLKLTITEKNGGSVNDNLGTVSFTANYKIKNQKFQMNEKSLFVKINNEWYYKEALSINFT